MRKFWLAVLALVCLNVFSAYAQMSDAAVVEYVKREVATGKGEKEIGEQLLAKGVTIQQMQRIKDLYEQSSATDPAPLSVIGQKVSRDSYAGADELGEAKLDAVASAVNNPNEQDGLNIYGHNVFNSRTLTFEPNENIATPANYKLGPGDEVIIDLWGVNETSIRQTISPEGRIIVSQIGPIYLNGLTIKEAGEKIRRSFSKTYAGVGGSNPSSQISVTLGQIRTIQINVMGEVTTPGTYRVSSFSTVFHAIYRAGGVTPIGSLREIKVIRAGKSVGTVDLYSYLFTGSLENDIKLEEGDVIQVPTYSNLVSVEGKVKRPMYYEMKSGETVADIIEYAGGFASDAYTSEVRLVRQSPQEKSIANVSAQDFAAYKVEDGDVISIDSNLDRFSNRIEVKGSVFRPGMYEIGGDIATVRQLIRHAGGLKEDAFTSRAIITREKDDLSLETVSFNLGGIMNGSVQDIALRKNDVVIISSVHELKDRGTLTINGAVAAPGEYAYADYTTVEDLIIQAGGLLEGASTARVDVSRRINDPSSTQATDVLGESFTFAIKDGLVVDGGDQFYLKPYDAVSVRMSPGYKTQRFVTVTGEVPFPGVYALESNFDRISDLIERAGGVNPQAYLKGGTLTRKTSQEEMEQQEISKEMAERMSGRDSLDVSKLDMEKTYLVALDFEKAVNSPGSEHDFLLKEGDVINIPEYVATVQVQGDVMYPTTVIYNRGKSFKSYIDAAGGYSQTSKRNKTYVVYANGQAQKCRAFTDIEPGCMIVVPSKDTSRRMSVGEMMSIGTTAASLGTMAASLANMIVRIGK